MKLKLLLVGLCIVFAVFSAGCRDRTHQINGAVTIYTSMYPDVINTIESAIRKEFPAVEIAFVQGETGALQAKIEEELHSGKLGCDIMLLADPSYALELKERGILHAYISPHTQNIALPYDPDGYWYPVRVSNMVLAYNAEKKQRNEVALSFKEFSELESLSGKIAMPNPLMSGSARIAVSALYDAYGELFFKNLKHQNIVVESSTSSIAKLESGEYDEIMVLEEAILKKRYSEHTPIELIYPSDGSIAITNSIVTVKNDYAAHCNIAVCNAITDWFLSDAGQKTIVEGWMHSVLKNPAYYPHGARASTEIFKNSIPIDWIKSFQNKENLRRMFETYILIENSP
ncbi:MAG: extracellular solute-binding protein [Treponema sp.]